MPAVNSRARLSGALSIAIAVFFFALMLFVGNERYFVTPGQPLFWDMAVYVRGIHAFLAGGNPYEHDSVLLFVYPPLFLKVAASLSRILHGESARLLYLLLNAVAILAIPVIFAKEYLRARWMTVGLTIAIFAFHPRVTGGWAFFAANLSNQIYALLLLTGAWGLRRNRWEAFYLVLVAGGVLKFPLLAFLLLPLMFGSRQILPAIVTIAAVAGANFMQRSLYPFLFQAYTETVRYAIIDRHDVGYGVFSTLFHIGLKVHALPAFVPYAAHIAVYGLVIVVLCLLQRRGWPGMSPAMQHAAVVLAAIQCNPRLLIYDLDVAVVPTVFLSVELTQMLLSRGVSKGMLLAIAAFFAVLFAVTGGNALALLAFTCEVCFLWIAWKADGPRLCVQAI